MNDVFLSYENIARSYIENNFNLMNKKYLNLYKNGIFCLFH